MEKSRQRPQMAGYGRRSSPSVSVITSPDSLISGSGIRTHARNGWASPFQPVKGAQGAQSLSRRRKAFAVQQLADSLQNRLTSLSTEWLENRLRVPVFRDRVAIRAGESLRTTARRSRGRQCRKEHSGRGALGTGRSIRPCGRGGNAAVRPPGETPTHRGAAMRLNASARSAGILRIHADEEVKVFCCWASAGKAMSAAAMIRIFLSISSGVV